MNIGNYFAVLARRCHERLPERIRRYLNARGIPDPMIDRHLLGWNGKRITIPITDRQGQTTFFKLAKDPEDSSDNPKMLTTPGAHCELYGWERVLARPERIIICEGEFDRLVLEAQGYAAVTSTGGASSFLSAWADALREIPSIFICYDNDIPGQDGAVRIAEFLPHARLVHLPFDVGVGGDVTDYFVRLGKTRADFEALLVEAQQLSQLIHITSRTADENNACRDNRDREIDRLKAAIPLEKVVASYLRLLPSGKQFVAHCPFHDDQQPSFIVYPQTRRFHCFGCRAHGDAIDFLMKMENLTFSEALNVLRRLLNP
jgi:DNA primase